MKETRSQDFGLTLLLSYVIGASAFFIDQMLRWTDLVHGFFNGMVLSCVFAFIWVLLFLPWCSAVYFIFRWKRWTRYRSHCALAPSVLVLCLTLGSLVILPPTAKCRLKHFAGADLPHHAGGLRYHISGGGLADYDDTYFFTCSPSDTDHLIAQMRLKKSDMNESGDHTPFRTLPGAPDFRAWQEATMYARHNRENGWSFYLMTNRDRTMVYIHIGCI